MTYGTPEYWENRAEQLGRQVANQDAQITALWQRLSLVEQTAARNGVNVDDQALSDHTAELEAIALSFEYERESLDQFRSGILTDLFNAQDMIEKQGTSKAVVFDWLAKRIPVRNAKAFPDNAIAKARGTVAARRAKWAKTRDEYDGLFEATA